MQLRPERGSSSAIYCHKKEVPKKTLLLCRRFLTCKAAASVVFYDFFFFFPSIAKSPAADAQRKIPVLHACRYLTSCSQLFRLHDILYNFLKLS